jgi:hypothetical protein
MFLLGFSVFVPRAEAQGWVFSTPPNAVTIAGKRNNVFYVGEPVCLWVTSGTATNFEVRNYFGTLVDSGTITDTSIMSKVTAPGWYKLYVYGATNQGAPYGNVVGGTTFTIIRPNANFPSMPDSFEAGRYLSWNLKGHVSVQINTIQQGSNGVVNGLFFDSAETSATAATVTGSGLSGTSISPPGGGASGSAVYVTSDADTEGNWKGVYGSDGYDVINDSESWPAYAQVTGADSPTSTWAAPTSDLRALERASSSGGRIAASVYSGQSAGNSFTIDINLTDGKAHQLALYALDWDAFGPRNETIQLIDPGTGNVLDTRTIGFFLSGKYLIWNVQGHIQVVVTNNVQGTNADISGLFFDPPGTAKAPATTSAQFVGPDTTTQGNWQGVYGADGFNVIGNQTGYPAYATVLPSSSSAYLWTPDTTNPRALMKVSGTDRVAAALYTPPTAGLGFDVNLTDGQTHKVSLYAEDWGSFGPRAETITIVDANSGEVLDTETIGATNGPQDGLIDELIRGITGMGPQRYQINDASNPDPDIVHNQSEIAVDKQMYTPYDPVRKRVLMMAFPNGTQDSAGVQQVVQTFQNDVEYWEGRNEPNYNYSGSQFVTAELESFYQTVKGVNPALKVLGPAIVTIGPGYGLSWIQDFLNAGGANYLDGFSFHAYNNINGDFVLADESLQGLQALLAQYNASNLEIWQTEQGAAAGLYGAYEPRLQGRWDMVQMMAYEQYGIPKEHNVLWYDVSHGFWDVPDFWENFDYSLEPAAPLMRVWSEELYGTTYSGAFDFGATGNKMYVGDSFSGANKNVAAFMSQGDPYGKIDLTVSSGTSIHCVSAFGCASDLPVVSGSVTLPVPELPVYVELQPNQTISVVPMNWGTNLATQPGVTAEASGDGVNPWDPTTPNSITKIHDGIMRDWFYAQGSNDFPWADDTPYPGSYPATVELDLPTVQTIDHVVVYANPSWELYGTLLDFDLQYDSGGQWVTIEHVSEPTNTKVVYTPYICCTCDSFFSDRWIFPLSFAPVVTGKIRLLVNNVTYGGAVDADLAAAGYLNGPACINLRQIEMYNASGVNLPGSGVPVTGGSNGTTTSGTSIIADPGFESPVVAGYIYDPTGSPWTFSGSSPSGSGISANDSAFTFTNGPAPEGVQVAFLQETGSFSQLINGLVPGAIYSLTFSAAQRAGNVQTWNVTMNGATIASYTPSTSISTYTDYTTTFTALAASETLAFIGTDIHGGDNSVFIDNLQLAESGSGTTTSGSNGATTSGSNGATTSGSSGALASGTTPAAVFVKSDTATQGNWKGVYGSDGFNIIDDTAQYPAYVTVNNGGAPTYEWTNSSTDVRALQEVSSTSNRIAACWYSPSNQTSFTIDLNITDGNVHQFALYALDWDGFDGGRADNIQIVDPTSGNVLDSESITNFQNGEYLVWTVRGHVQVIVTTNNPNSNSVINGLFFDPPGATGSSGGTTTSGSNGTTTSGSNGTTTSGSNGTTTSGSNGTTTSGSNGATTSGSSGALASGTTPAAVFLKSDTATQGNWKGVYGSDGFNIIDDTAQYPAYVTVNNGGAPTYEWTNSSTDVRALQEVSSSSSRIVACWYSPSNQTSFTIDLNITDGNAHQFALYALDWDGFGGGRADNIQIVDPTSGNVLDTESITNFQNGEYLVWTIRGHVQVIVTTNNPNSNSVVNGLFFDTSQSGTTGSSGGTTTSGSNGTTTSGSNGTTTSGSNGTTTSGSNGTTTSGSSGVLASGTAPAAVFVNSDTATQGNWKGVYGSDGFNVIDDTVQYPAYVTVSNGGAPSYEWTNSSTEVRALKEVSSTSNRIAACWYSSSNQTSFTIDLNITDGNAHQFALYALDWDSFGGPRADNIRIVDPTTGNVLDTESITNFQNGEYLIWTIRGHVQVTVTTNNPNSNSVVNGLFFDPPGTTPAPPGPSAQFVTLDGTTQGNWDAVYGSDGYSVLPVIQTYPPYAAVTSTGATPVTWAAPTSDPRALQTMNREASCWYTGGNAGSSYTINVNLTDGNSHRVAVYALDWDSFDGPRSDTIQITDASSGAVLDTESITNFQNGEYLVWDLKGNVNIRVINTVPGSNAVLSGIFFGAIDATPKTITGSSGAVFINADTNTQGNWKSCYGIDGYNVAGGPSSYPAYATVSISGQSFYDWISSTSDPRATETSGGPSRSAGAWTTSNSNTYTVDLNLTDGLSHKLAVYALDWDGLGGGRSERLDIIDPRTGNLLNSQTLSSFQTGEYVVWSLSGHVQLVVTNLNSASNAVISGLFLGRGGRN